jgi:2-(1,2-epoxy-1,2-dihydrophenyl)acetyl-CoA isomerase
LSIDPDLGATWMLFRRPGRSLALGTALLGERIDAVQAERWGRIWRCVDDADLSEQAHAQRLGSTSAAAVRDKRRLIHAAPGNNLTRQRSDERTAQRPHVAGDFFNTACVRFLASARNN